VRGEHLLFRTSSSGALRNAESSYQPESSDRIDDIWLPIRTPVTSTSISNVATEFWNAGSRPFHFEFRYMMNQLPPTTMKPKKKTASPASPPT